MGHRTSIVVAAGTPDASTLTQKYDIQGRLIASLGGNASALLAGDHTQAEIDAIWAQSATTYTYDAAGRQISTTDPAGNRTLYFYDADGKLTHTVDALGDATETKYDGVGRVLSHIAYGTAIDTAGLTGGLVPLDLLDRLATIANPSLDQVRTNTYNADGTVASTTDALGNVTTFTYDAFKELSSSISPLDNGRTIARTSLYDHRGQLIRAVIDPAGANAVTQSTYDAFGRVTSVTDANGNVSHREYDRAGNTVAVVDPLGNVTQTSYDGFSRALSVTSPRGTTTHYAYDDASRSVTVTTPEGVQLVTSHDRNGRTVAVSDGNGNSTTYTYDADGNLRSTTTPLSQVTSQFDSDDRLIETVDANGNRTAYTYDAVGRVLTRTVDPDGLALVTSYAYDSLGRQISTTDANGHITTISFDLENHVISRAVDPSGLNLITQYEYDAAGNVRSVMQPNGNATTYTYDTQGRRVTAAVDPDGLNIVTSYTYDAAGNLAAVTDANGNTSHYFYDADNRLRYTVDALGDVSERRYDAAGNVTLTASYVARLELANLPQTATPTDIEALVVRTPGQDTLRYSVYDDDGRLDSIVDGNGALTQFSYDGNGNVISRTQFATPVDVSRMETAGYRPTPTIDVAHDQSSSTIYDAENRAIFTVTAANGIIEQHYDANGNILERIAYTTPLPAGTPRTEAGIRAAIAHFPTSASNVHTRSTYDAANREIYTVDGVGAVTRSEYDKVGNLTREVRYATPIAAGAAPESVQESDIDRVTDYIYDAANRNDIVVNAMGTVTTSRFDGNGNLIQRTVHSTQIGPGVPRDEDIWGSIGSEWATNTSTIVYDGANRPVFSIDGNGSVTKTVYDGAGNAVTTIQYNQSSSFYEFEDVSLETVESAMNPDALSDRVTRRQFDAAGQCGLSG